MAKIQRYTKAILAAVFGLSPAAVVGLLAAFGVHLDVDTVAALLGGLSPLLAAFGVAVGPANQ
jgi:uncharacterized membrane protein